MVELARGVRDFTIEEMQLRTTVLSAISEQFLLYGFTPLETPIIERLETLNAKMSGSESTDVMKEIFQVSDQGGRELGLRYDLTVPLARYVAMHKDLRLPFRRSEIGKVYRDGPVKLGRYREFIQCDADIVGSSNPIADAECIMLAQSVFDELEIDVAIHVNDRKVLDAICAKAGITDTAEAIIAIDKLAKIGEHGVREELLKKGVSNEQADTLFSLVNIQGTNDGKIAFLEHELGAEPLINLRQTLTAVGEGVEFIPSLARGLAYYTGTVFEAFALESEIKSSLMGGGRYDNLIGILGGEKHPAVGISFGIEPICEVLKASQQSPPLSATKVFIAPIGNTISECVKLARTLRSRSISCILDVSSRSITKNIEYASKERIPTIIIIGEKDLAEGMLTVKHLDTGDEHKTSLNDIEKLILELEVR